MALFNEILAARFNEGLGRLLQMEKSPAAPSLAPEIQAVLNLGDALGDPLNALLFGYRLFYGDDSDAADVAAVSHVTLRNPAGSNQILHSVATIMNLTAGNLTYNVGSRANGAVDATAAVQNRDRRLTSTSGITTHLSTVGAAFGSHFQVSVRAGESLTLPFGIILPPGFEAVVGGAVVNVAVNAVFYGHYRNALPNELEGF